jgi:hypothetical protein
MSSQEINAPECCPPFDPSLWEDKTFTWENKLFIKDKVSTFMYMPIGFGKVMIRINKKVLDAGAAMPDFMCLSDHTSSWNMNVYLAVDKEIPGSENLKLSGNFFSKVYEGPFKDSGKWCRDYEAVVKSKGLNVKKWYMWYTTCPKCAKKYGKNYVVIIGKVE